MTDGDDDDVDILGMLVAQARATGHGPPADDLARSLPEPPPLDEDGFAPSICVEDADGIRDFFAKYGYVVVRDVLTSLQVEKSREEFFSKFDKDVEDSIAEFLDPRYANMFSPMGIIGTSNDVESISLLENRQNEKVYRAFSAVYGGETRLFVDHDRLGAMRPTLQTDGTIRKEWQTINNWLHLDCNPVSGEISIASMAPPESGGHHDFDAEAPFLVQGLLALSDAREEDGGFLCVPGSHRIAKEWTVRNDFERKEPQLRPEPGDPLQRHVRRVPVRAGSLVVWNQFTMHANHPNRSDRWRLNQYIRMYPVERTRFRPLLPDVRDYPSDFARTKITPLGRKLFGIDTWDV